MFDIIINRYETFDFNEVYSVLESKGLFITQQVDELNNKKLLKLLISDFKEITRSQYTLKNNLTIIESKEFVILKSDKYLPLVKFLNIGALVYFAKIIYWELIEFSVNKCFKELCKLQSIIDEHGLIASKEHRFIILSQKSNMLNLI